MYIYFYSISYSYSYFLSFIFNYALWGLLYWILKKGFLNFVTELSNFKLIDILYISPWFFLNYLFDIWLIFSDSDFFLFYVLTTAFCDLGGLIWKLYLFYLVLSNDLLFFAFIIALYCSISEWIIFLKCFPSPSVISILILLIILYYLKIYLSRIDRY